MKLCLLLRNYERLKSYINPSIIVISIIRKMSVDVFGRQLDKSAVVKNRGPPGNPGIGFKLTADGHYDLKDKRLSNVAHPEQPSDAATLNTVHRKIHNTVKLLRKEMNDSNLLLVQGLEATIQNIIKTLNINLQTVQDLATQNSKAISDLDSRLNVLKNERAQESTRRGIA